MTEITTGRWHDWLLEVVDEDAGTASNTITKAVIPTATRTVAALLTEDVGNLRHKASTLHVDLAETHQKVYEHEWGVLTQQRGAQSAAELLEHLGDLGFAWRDVARMVGVSVPAVKKWRRGERITGPNRLRVAQLVAACDFLSGHYHVEDVASWFEMPLRDDAPVTPMDLWMAGQARLMFDYGTGHATADETLTAFEPEWRDHYRTNVETFQDADGNIGLRMTDR